jgi:hypothetical protein
MCTSFLIKCPSSTESFNLTHTHTHTKRFFFGKALCKYGFRVRGSCLSVHETRKRVVMVQELGNRGGGGRPALGSVALACAGAGLLEQTSFPPRPCPQEAMGSALGTPDMAAEPVGEGRLPVQLGSRCTSCTPGPWKGVAHGHFPCHGHVESAFIQ